eukprot:m.70502 g.70502  ORF g.70502 m.70502 type:complete len:1257 (+) comp14167_c0_seq1:503-4273(+)
MRGKVLSATNTNSFTQIWSMLRAAGMDIMTLPKQLRFAPSPHLPISELLSGQVDVASVPAGVLEHMVSQGQVDPSKLKVLEEQFHSIDGQPFPYRHSSPLDLTDAIIAMPWVSKESETAIVDALNSITPSHEAAQQGGYHSWSFPSSYARSLSLQVYLGATHETESGGLRCQTLAENATYNPYDFYDCPAGSFYRPKSDLPLTCEQQGLPCQSPLFCVCSPCIFGEEVQLAAGNLVEDSSEPSVMIECELAKTCFKVEQRQLLHITIQDRLADRRDSNFTFATSRASLYSDNTLTAMADGVEQSAVQSDGVWLFDVSYKFVSLVPITIFRNGEALPNSPILIDVVQRTCGSGEATTSDGACVCATGNVRVRGRCRPVHDLAPSIAFGVLGFVLLLAIAGYLHRERRRISTWSINPQDLTEDSTAPPAARGCNAKVKRVKYKGNFVVRKTFHKLVKSGQSTANILKNSTDQHVSSLSEPRTVLSTRDRRRLATDLQAIRKLRHPCIVSVIGYSHDGHRLSLIMEACSSSLKDMLRNSDVDLELDVRLTFLKDISMALHFLHSRPTAVVHGALKSSNCLVDSNLRIKLSDFGIRTVRCEGEELQLYQAPEVLQGQPASCASDVFSFGILVAELLSRKRPYQGIPVPMVVQELIKPSVKQPLRPQIDTSNNSLHRLATTCWLTHADHRPSMESVKQDVDGLGIGTISTSLFTRSLERKLQKRVLYDCFPPHIAEKLKKGEKIKPEQRDNVTLFFSDIVGFTNISSTIEPGLVSDMLDRLYHKFDDLANKYELFKVETIGDAYFCASNLVSDQSEHAIRIAMFSIEAIRAAKATPILKNDPSRGFVNIRVGFHCGSVVTNVVGNKNARFCLFGDTVNTASRMESNSLKNFIHISTVAANELRLQCKQANHKVDALLRSRGQISIKGKGMMETFWVVLPEDIELYDSGEMPDYLPDASADSRASTPGRLHLARDASLTNLQLPTKVKVQKPKARRSSRRRSSRQARLSLVPEAAEDEDENGESAEAPVTSETSAVALSHTSELLSHGSFDEMRPEPSELASVYDGRCSSAYDSAVDEAEEECTPSDSQLDKTYLLTEEDSLQGCPSQSGTQSSTCDIEITPVLAPDSEVLASGFKSSASQPNNEELPPIVACHQSEKEAALLPAIDDTDDHASVADEVLAEELPKRRWSFNILSLDEVEEEPDQLDQTEQAEGGEKPQLLTVATNSYERLSPVSIGQIDFLSTPELFRGHTRLPTTDTSEV